MSSENGKSTCRPRKSEVKYLLWVLYAKLFAKRAGHLKTLDDWVGGGAEAADRAGWVEGAVCSPRSRGCGGGTGSGSPGGSKTVLQGKGFTSSSSSTSLARNSCSFNPAHGICSVVEVFHFGPAPASQDGGSGSTTLVIYAFNTAPLLMIFFIFLMVVSKNQRSDMPNNYRITLFEYTNIDSVYF